MPERYEAIKRSLRKQAKKKGKKVSEQDIKTSAAKIFNATRRKGQRPVTRKSK